MRGHITDPSAPAGLDLREVPDPVPGPHDVLVEVRAYGVNRGELTLLTNRVDGWMPGQDVAGVVAAPAADGTGPPPGARVVGVADQGGWSELAAIPSHRVAVLPDGVTFERAAALPVAGLTALRALRTGGALLGSPVLVTGASGGVGTFAVQLAALAGAHVTALVSDEHRADAVRALGAGDVVTALDEQTGPFELVLEGVGGQVLVDAVRRLAKGGTLTAYGVAGGPSPSPLAFYDFAPLSRLIAFFIYATGEETFGEDLRFLAGLVAEGKLSPQLGAVLDWSQTAAAVDALRQRSVTGKVVLTRT
jgi:NADPH:quinone reductase-like Zn-dependent oxidoreductase